MTYTRYAVISHTDQRAVAWSAIRRVLAKHAYVLSQLFAYPVVVVDEKVYVGRKRLDNKHGNVVDLLGTVPAAVLIEIKTPQMRLLGGRYREGV